MKFGIPEFLKKEPIGWIGLVIAVFAVIPSWINFYANSSYAYHFSCTEVDPNTPALLVEGEYMHDFVAVLTKCDFSNLDDQTISIKQIAPTATFEASSGSVIEFQNFRGITNPRSDFRFLDQHVAHAVPEGQSLLFDEFYLIPVSKFRKEQDQFCENVDFNNILKLYEIGNCIQDLSQDCINNYLAEMIFPSGGLGYSPYRNISIRLKLADDSHAVSPMRLSWYYDSFFTESNFVDCPIPDKNLEMIERIEELNSR